MMTMLKCKTCGSHLVKDERAYVCPNCGNRYVDESKSSSIFEAMLGGMTTRATTAPFSEAFILGCVSKFIIIQKA